MHTEQQLKTPVDRASIWTSKIEPVNNPDDASLSPKGK